MKRFLSTFHTTAALAVAVLSLVAPLGTATANNKGLLPRPAELAHDIHFWVRIYSEVTTGGGLIHDSRHLEVVYEKIEVPKGLSRKARERLTDKVKARYSKILATLAKGKRSGLTSEEARILALWPSKVTNSELKAAKKRLRFQLGQADKFRTGIIRSGRWNDFIAKVFDEHGLPKELTALPHVESSFTPWAYSHVGAAGLWQFTRSTGRRFLRVDHVIDERLDPYRATVAAARLLSQNREVTGTWPLAITAYNHGASGMRRAAKKLGTKDIAVINRKYKSRTFGFASRNFYVELLAASEVSSNYEKYFGPLTLETPPNMATFEVPFYTTPAALCKALGIDLESFEKVNPSLRPAIWRGAKYLPRRFPLHAMQAELSQPISVAIESIPKSLRHAAQKHDLDYRVRRGDTLSTIARRFKVSMSELVAINGLRSRHKIRVGQKLKLPDDGRGSRARASARTVKKQGVPSSGTYVVRRGDTITRIATRFGLDESEILEANRLRNRHRIYVGQSLNLRKTQASSAPAKVAKNTKATKAKKVEPEPHPDAVAALSNPPERPPEIAEPVHAETVAAELANQPAAPADEVQLETLLADPSDYGVSGDKTIEVQGAETLGHYAEWLDIRASQLRRLNGLPYERTIEIGQRIKLDFSQIDMAVFEVRRQDYHRQLQEAFFERYEIEGTRSHTARRGDSVWHLAEKKYRVPLWLLRQYNPDIDFGALRKGMRIQVPELKERESWAAPEVVSRTS